MSADASDRDDDGISQRLPGGRVRTWLLLNAERWQVAAALLGGIFAVLVIVGTLDPVPLRAAVRSSDPIETLFQALIPAIVTGVTLVVSINQLVLSQELGPAGDQRERMEGAMQFRRDVEDIVDAPVSPADPARFVRALVDETAERAAMVRTTAAGDGGDVREHIEEYAEGVQSDATAVSRHLEDAQFGTYEVVGAALDFEYSSKIHRARRFRADDAVGDETRAALDDLLAPLELFAATREHLKTLYFQWELIDLSRAVLYAAVPALAVTISMVLYVDDPGTVTGRTLGADNLVLLASAAATVALAPFALFLSYILRIATVAKRTLAIGPFVLRERNRGGG